MKTPRSPTDAEKQALVNYIRADDSPKETRLSESLVDQACVAVFEDYISDGPGYKGPIMMVVWSGGPEIHEVFTWDREVKLVPNRAYPLQGP